MSFLSMLQMARGKEAPPENRKATGDRSRDPPKTSNEGNRPAEIPQKPDVKQQPRIHKPAPPIQNPGSVTSKVVKPQPAKTINKPVGAPLAERTVKSARDIPTTTRTGARASAEARVGAGEPRNAGATKKKLSFKEMMKQAANIDRTKLEVNLKIANKSPPPQPRRSARLQRTNASPVLAGAPPAKAREVLHSRKLPSRPVQVPSSRSPAPFAQPSPELMQKLEQRKKAKAAARGRYDEDDEEDLDDFVVSEEEEEEPVDTSSEIWSMFNRRPRSYYSKMDSDDDMEATGDDILSEERRSAAQARREDVEEERKLEELARKKKLRRNH